MADGEIRIEITGDARDFRRALAGVSGDIANLKKQSFGLGDALKTAFSAAAGFLAANVIQDGLRALSGAVGGAISKAAELESELNFLQAVSGATGEQMRQVAALAKQLGADVTIPAASALDAAKAMTELAKAGLSVEQAMAAAKGSLQLAAAGQLDAARAAEIVAGALNAFNLQGDQAVRVADLLAAAANASAADVTSMADALKMASAVAAMSGRSVEETITALSLMANAGIQGSDAGTSLKTMLLRLVAPTDKAAEMMEELGIKLTDSKGRMLPLRDIVGQFSRALSKLTEDQRNYTLAAIFGSDAIRAANIILMAGVEAYDEMYRAVTKANAAAELAEARMRGLRGAKEALNNAIETLGLSFGEKLLPVLAQVGFVIADLLTDERVIQFVEELGEKIGGFLAEAFALVRDVVRQVDFSSLISTARMAGEEMGRMFQPVLAGVAKLNAAIAPVLQDIGVQVQALVKQGFRVLGEVFADIKPVAQDALSAIGELLSALAPHVQNVIRALSPLVTQIGNALLTFARHFGAVIRDALATLSSFIRAIAALLRGDMDGFLRYLGDAVRNLGEMVKNAIRGAVETVAALIGVNLSGVLSFIERVTNALLSLRNFGLNVVQTVIENLNRIRLPFGIGGGQQQMATQTVTNNYLLTVNAAPSQGVISDFELMRRLGWR